MHLPRRTPPACPRTAWWSSGSIEDATSREMVDMPAAARSQRWSRTLGTHGGEDQVGVVSPSCAPARQTRARQAGIQIGVRCTRRESPLWRCRSAIVGSSRTTSAAADPSLVPRRLFMNSVVPSRTLRQMGRNAPPSGCCLEELLTNAVTVHEHRTELERHHSTRVGERVHHLSLCAIRSAPTMPGRRSRQ